MQAMKKLTHYMMAFLLAGLLAASCKKTDDTAYFQRYGDEIGLNAEGNATPYYIRISGEWHTEIENGSEWIQLSPASGNGNGELGSIAVSASQKAGISREGTFFLCGQGYRFPVRVVQAGAYFRMVKRLPRLVVLDWGEYEKGSGTNGFNGTERAFTLELAYSEASAPIRKYTTTREQWLSSSNQFYSHNRFAIGGLKPNTDYVFRMTPLDASHTDVGTFHTPAEPLLDAHVLLYKDFDNFWWGGCPIYQAYGIQPSQNDIGNNNLDPADAAVWLRNDPCVNPSNSTALYFNYKSAAATDVRSPLKCPKYWNYCWEGDKYGTNYGDAAYTGWTGYNVRHCTGSVLLGTASAEGTLSTPYLTALGATSTTIIVTVNSAAYYESYHRNYAEDNLRHLIKVEGAGTILDGGPTCQLREDKQVTVECATNVASNETLQPMYDTNIPTTHTVTIGGANSTTRIVIKSATASKNRFWIDDIKIERK